MDRRKASTERVTMPFDERKVVSQLGELTLEEKVSLLGGSGFATTTGIPRLGIPSMRIAEGVNGVKDAMMIDSGDAVGDVLAGKGPKTVCFPSTACFAATWNTSLMLQLGEALGQQAQLKGVATIMGPGVNLHRDPRGGRNFEYFSEDPLLTGQLAAAMVNGIQANGVGACLKHFVANEAEDYRRSYNVVDPTGGRALRELYLAAFQEALRHSDPVAIMTSYNKVDGLHTSESPLIQDILRKEWKYAGAVQSDWFGTASTVDSILAGQDLEMPGPPIFRGQPLVNAVREGKVTEAQIDERARKMLEWIDRATGNSPCSRSVAENNENATTVAHKVASEGLVLLKNDANVLPLDLTRPQKIAICGLQAVDPPIGGGGSSLAPPISVKKPFDYIQAAHCQPDLVTYAGGVKMNKIVPLIPTSLTHNGENDSPGIRVTYYNDTSSTALYHEDLDTAQITMLGHIKPGLDEAGFSYEMSTILKPETDGKHTIGVRSTGSYRLMIDGKEVLSAPATICNAEDLLFTPANLQKTVAYHMRSGGSYSIKLVVHDEKSPKQKPNEPGAYSTALCFEQEHSTQNAIESAVVTARSSDVAIVFAGRNPEYESEGFDLPDLDLPGDQVELIQAISAVSKNTILVLSSGGPLDVSEVIDSVDAILYAHYSGQEVGSVIADVLTGKVNPSGKLNTTWPRRVADIATWTHFPAVERPDGTKNLVLVEGLTVGHRRNWEEVTGGPRYRFGFGLSYTQFSLTDLALQTTAGSANFEDSNIEVSITVTNTGAVAGYDVVQVYIAPSKSSSQLRMHPVKALKGFKKVAVEPQQSVVVEVVLETKVALSFWNTDTSTWQIEKGVYSVTVSDGVTEVSQDLKVEQDYAWSGL